MSSTLRTREQAYEVTPAERDPWGDAWCGPETLDPREEHRIAELEPASENHGHHVVVFCRAFPTRLYRLEVATAKRTMGRQPDPGCNVYTSIADLYHVVWLATSIASGRLEIDPRFGR